jgi:endoglucanase Acf2
VSLSSRSRPQYHYFYGSTETDGADAHTDATNEGDQDTLFGEELVPTDHEEEIPQYSERDIPHLLITNRHSSPPFSTSASSSCCRPDVIGTVPVIVLIFGIITFLVVIFPPSVEPMPIYGVVPYQHVDRADSYYGDAVESFISMNLFHPTLLSETKPRSFKFPFPSGAFWTNLVVPLEDDGNDATSYPIVVYPYAYKWAKSELQLSYPAAHRYTGKKSIQDSFQADITISTKEEAKNRFITKFDPLSVTLRFVATPEIKWETSLVQGSPYTTIKFLDSTPRFSPLSTFKSVQCPGDDNEKFSDLLITNEVDGGFRRELFGVCSIDVSGKVPITFV